MVLLQGEKAIQAVAAFMEDEGGQQASCAAVAVLASPGGTAEVGFFHQMSEPSTGQATSHIKFQKL